MSDQRLSTGEAIRVVLRADGRYQATADIMVYGAPVGHHAIDATPEAACDRLRFVLGQGPAPASGSLSSSPYAGVVCAIKGQGRLMQCTRPGAWPEHIPDPPAEEQRCTACDDYKASIGILDQAKDEWERRRKMQLES